MSDDEPLAALLSDISSNSRGATSRLWLLLALLLGASLLVAGYLFLATPTELAPLPTFHPQRIITVDVEGAVNRPGVQNHSLAFDEKLYVAQLVASAGGLAKGADTVYFAKTYNQAQSVDDGYKLYVQKLGEETILKATVGLSQVVNLNSASAATLEDLKGVGEVRAKAIIEHRPYTTLEDFLAKTKLPASLFADKTRFSF
ncbi:MAG TPA: helix-hairpin-helix domain-containing protein [Patescibacteria group bacterium]|nr:helix-hairpin-helix domain-containing protein [Patescibacteria group bacterium]